MGDPENKHPATAKAALLALFFFLLAEKIPAATQLKRKILSTAPPPRGGTHIKMTGVVVVPFRGQNSQICTA